MRYQVMAGSLTVVVALLVGATATTAAKDDKAVEILAATRKAIGKLDSLKGLSVQATLQRNVGSFQSQSDVEMLLEMPDKYLRSDAVSSGMNMTLTTGFNGDKAIMPAGMRVMPGGAMVVSMGPGGSMHAPETEKPTPEQLEAANKASLRNYRQELSRLMLGWFGSAHPSLKAQYSYVGEAESPDGKAYVIDVKDEDGFAARLFIDVNSKLPLMVSYQGRARQVMTSGMPGGNTAGGGTRVVGPGGTTVSGSSRQLSEEEIKKLREQADKNVASLTAQGAQQTVEYSMFFEDWKEVDGINFPHVMRRASKGATDEEWTVRKVKVNPKIDPRKFETK